MVFLLNYTFSQTVKQIFIHTHLVSFTVVKFYNIKHSTVVLISKLTYNSIVKQKCAKNSTFSWNHGNNVHTNHIFDLVNSLEKTLCCTNSLYFPILFFFIFNLIGSFQLQWKSTKKMNENHISKVEFKPFSS